MMIWIVIGVILLIVYSLATRKARRKKTMHREIRKVIKSREETVHQSGIHYLGAWQYALDRGERDNQEIDFISFKIPLDNKRYLVTVFKGLGGSAGLTVRDMDDIDREAAEYLEEYRILQEFKREMEFLSTPDEEYK